MTDLPDIRLLREFLSYDPAPGKLLWLKRGSEHFSDMRACIVWNKRCAGREAFTTDNGDGYRVGRLFGELRYAHRVIWALVVGEWPVGAVDHVNGVRDDNRISNLRDVRPSENARNQKRHRTNTSGVAGVGWCNTFEKWIAKIHVDGKPVTLGYFKCFDHAVVARKDAETTYHYHPNHGRHGGPQHG